MTVASSTGVSAGIEESADQLERHLKATVGCRGTAVPGQEQEVVLFRRLGNQRIVNGSACNARLCESLDEAVRS